MHFVFIKRKKRNSFCLARKSARNPGFLLIITGWGESGKAILQFFRALSKIFRAKMAQPPWKKLARTPMYQPLVGLGELSFLLLEYSVEYLNEYSSTRQGSKQEYL